MPLATRTGLVLEFLPGNLRGTHFFSLVFHTFNVMRKLRAKPPAQEGPAGLVAMGTRNALRRQEPLVGLDRRRALGQRGRTSTALHQIARRISLYEISDCSNDHGFLKNSQVARI